MEFLNAALIAGTVLGGVPVLIHLLNRRRYRETLWAAMEFLREALQYQARRMRLEDAALLALRIAALVLLALALGRPTLTGRFRAFAGGAPRRGTTAIILLDNSYSMGAAAGGRSTFDRARDLARTVVRTLPRGTGSRAAVLAVNDRVEPLVAHLSHDLEAVDLAIGTARLSDGGTDLARGLAYVRDQLLPQVQAARAEVHLITDSQERFWQGDAALAEVLTDIARKARLYIAAVPLPDGENLAVTDLRIPDLTALNQPTQDILPSTHTPLSFLARVKNLGRRPREYVAMGLWVNGALADRQVIGRLEPGGSKTVAFRTSLGREGSHHVRAQLDIGPGDRLARDNARHLTLHVYDQVRVLAVDGDPRPGPFESETDYIRLALSPVDLEAPDEPFLVTTQVCTREELEGVRLADYRVVVLANVAGVSRGLAERLVRYVRAGGGLIIFLGDQVDVQDYNDVLYAEGAGLLPARLTGLIGEPTDQTRFFALETGSLTHYLVSHYAPTDPTLSRVRVFAAIGADPSGVPDTEVVLRYTTGPPAVMCRPLGLGQVILVTTTANDDWTNLPGTNALVPLMQRAVNYLVFGQMGPDRLNLLPGRPFVYRVRPEETAYEVTITDPEGHPRGFPGQTGRERIEYADTWRAGFYRVELATPESRVTGFAVNLETEESDLTVLDEAAVRQRFPDVPFTWAAADDDRLAADLRRQRVGTEIWHALIVVVLVALVGEALLARALSLRGTSETHTSSSS